MGVPTVTKVGDALFERLSYSILNNAGLPELCGDSSEAFVDIAVRLAPTCGIFESSAETAARAPVTPLDELRRRGRLSIADTAEAAHLATAFPNTSAPGFLMGMMMSDAILKRAILH